jgi:hypothetical protein
VSKAKGSAAERLKARRGLVEREIPGFGTAYFRRLTTDEVLDLAGLPDQKEFRRRAVALSWVEEDGTPVVNADEAGAIDWAIGEPISKAVMDVSGLNDKDGGESPKHLPPSTR